MPVMETAASMRFESFVSESESTARAVDEIVDRLRDTDLEADVAFVFFTAHHVEQASEIIERLWLEIDPQAMVGCSAEGVIGGDREIERTPGITVLAGQMPGVRMHPFHVASDDWREIITDTEALKERLAVGEETRAIIGFGDPFTTPLNQFLAALDEAAPSSPLIGGMASAARQPGENRLVRNDEVLDDGFVGVSLSGALEVQTIVSQGCRPIGQPMVVTKARENIVEQLGGKPALEVLRDMINSLGEVDRALLSHGLLIGRAISEYRETFGRGDFLVRNLMGVDQSSGAIAMADRVRIGQTVQFHVRDADTASEDLNLMLETQRFGLSPAAALLFSCNGRGTRMFEQSCHDVKAAREAMANTPVAGFFAAGEFGPVGGKNFIHGHTASFALLRAGKPRA